MSDNIKKMLKLFVTFFKIGLFTFGGGFAMIPLMEKEIVDKHGWIDKEKFIDAISITQSVPGAVAINLAIFFGYNLAGFVGALVAVVGVAIPSFVIILIIAFSFQHFADIKVVQNMFRGIRPAVVGLILYAGIDLAQSIDWFPVSVISLVFVVIASTVLDINSIIIILSVILVGSLLHNMKTSKKGEKKVLFKGLFD